MFQLYRLIEKQLPSDHCRQVSSKHYIERVLRDNARELRVLDLGCGTGRSLDLFRSRQPQIEWHGVDIRSSPEVNERRRTDGSFTTFDGLRLPFREGAFDVVYSHQVFEHVRHPEDLLREVYRVLKPGGLFVGSTSHLEPYHSFSLWNYTPYGFLTLLESAGFEVLELRPGIDAVTLTVRSMLPRTRLLSMWFDRESPVNALIGIYGRFRKARVQTINAAKLSFCGQFCFMAVR
jgi:SAM-dependent methyltransferase